MSPFLDILQNYTMLSYFHNCLNYLSLLFPCKHSEKGLRYENGLLVGKIERRPGEDITVDGVYYSRSSRQMLTGCELISCESGYTLVAGYVKDANWSFVCTKCVGTCCGVTLTYSTKL
jgi:hypothetical protein